MTIALHKRPKRFKSNTPITIAIPKAQKERIRQLFSLSISAIEEDRDTPTDWYNCAFRTKHALEIAKVVYVQETVDELQAILDMITVKATCYPEHNWFKFDNRELDQIKSMHEAMSTMEDEVTRRVQLDAVLLTEKFMKQFIKKE